jgi:hypothetical protein
MSIIGLPLFVNNPWAAAAEVDWAGSGVSVQRQGCHSFLGDSLK